METPMVQVQTLVQVGLIKQIMDLQLVLTLYLNQLTQFQAHLKPDVLQRQLVTLIPILVF